VHTPKSFSRHALLRAVRMPALALALSPLVASAQVVRGIVVDEGSGRGLPGVVVVLLDSAGKRLAGVLADDDGRYAIRITIAGHYSVRAERIGYRADAPTPVALAVGQTVELRLVTRPIPVVLGAVRVTGRSPCVARASDGREVSQVWEETRKALYATDLTQQQELFTARVSRYERTLDAQTGRVTGYQAKQATGTTRSPFVSDPAAELSASGYVRQGPTGETTYYGPDAGVLLSEEFLRDHCFRLRDGDGRRAGQIGLAFEPVKGREKPDIAGTLWVDRKTAELRDLEYSYSRLPNLPGTAKSDDFGGHMEFHRMPTGAWIVERWVIRMPVLVDRGAFSARSATVIPGSALTRPERIQLAAVREEGGEVIETMARGARREVVTEVASVRGIVFDSTRMRPLGGARVFVDGTQFATQSAADGSYTIAQVPPGTYSVAVVHPRFDSLSIVAPSATVALRGNEESVAQLAGPSAATIIQRDCAAEERTAGRAVLRGHVRDGFKSGPAIDAQVTVTWNHLQTSVGAPVGVSERRLVTRTDSAGRYDICGLPDGVRLTALVTSDDRRSAPVQLILPADEVSVIDMVVGRPTVVASAESAPVVAAVAPVAVAPRASRNRAMAEFERRRRRGNGEYLTREQIDRMHASRLTDLLRTLPGVTVEANESGALVVELRRSKSLTFEPVPVARNDSTVSPATAAAQMSGQLSVRKCPASFQVDGLAIDGGATVDIEVRPETIEAIEVYSGGQVPIEVGAHNAECGVVLIWTRAFAERSHPAPGSDGNR
jgi:carboxypeptidase family protein